MQENTAALFDKDQPETAETEITGQAAPDGTEAESPSPLTQPAEPAKPQLAYEFLPEYLDVLERPPSNVARYFVLGIIALALITLAWAILGRIDIIASAKGRLIIDDRSKVVQAPDQGEVNAIQIRDGQLVKQGDVLIALNRTSSEAESARLENRLITVGLDIARTEALLTTNAKASFIPPANTPAHRIKEAEVTLDAEMIDYQVRVSSLEYQIKQNETQRTLAAKVAKQTRSLIRNVKERLKGRKRLLDSGHIPPLEYLELEKEVIEEERDYAQLIADAATLELEGLKLEQQLLQLDAENRKTLHDRLTELRSEYTDAEKQLIQANELLRKMTIKAPVDGVVQQLAVHTLGGVVTQGQELMIIVPEGLDLEAEVTIENKDVGFVRSGQPVEVKVDSFPYTKYGTIKGEVIHVSRDSMEDEQQGLVFPARVRLTAQTVQADDEVIQLSAGMSISAEIKTGDRRVIDYLLSPLKEYQSESLNER